MNNSGYLFKHRANDSVWLYLGEEKIHPIFHDECDMHKLISIEGAHIGTIIYEYNLRAYDGPFHAKIGNKVIT